MNATGGLDFRHVLHRTAQVLKSAGLQACGLYALTMVPRELLYFYLPIKHTGQAIWIGLLTIIFLFGLSITSCLLLFSKHLREEHPSLRLVMMEALSPANWWRMNVTTLLVMFLVFAAVAASMIVIPGTGAFPYRETVAFVLGIWVLSRIGFAPVLALRPPWGPFDAIHQSWALTQRHGWRSLGYVALMFTVCFIFPHLLRDAVLSDMLRTGISTVQLSAINLLQGLPLVLFLAFMVCYCEALEARHLEDEMNV